MPENLIKYLSLITVGAIILGYSSLSSFYASFGINIVYYVSTTEFLYELLPLTAAIFIFYFYFLKMVLEPGPKTTIETDPTKSKKKKRIRAGIEFAILVGVLVLYFVLDSKYKEYRAKPLLMSAMTAYTLYTFTGPYIRKAIREGKIEMNHVVALFLVTGVIMREYETFSGEVIKSLGPNKHFAFNWKGKQIKSDSVNYLIGETQSYLFLYSKKDSSTHIYRRSDIDSLVVKITN